jgi:hypothetical protein
VPDTTTQLDSLKALVPLLALLLLHLSLDQSAAPTSVLPAKVFNLTNNQPHTLAHKILDHSTDSLLNKWLKFQSIALPSDH